MGLFTPQKMEETTSCWKRAAAHPPPVSCTSVCLVLPLLVCLTQALSERFLKSSCLNWCRGSFQNHGCSRVRRYRTPKFKHFRTSSLRGRAGIHWSKLSASKNKVLVPFWEFGREETVYNWYLWFKPAGPKFFILMRLRSSNHFGRFAQAEQWNRLRFHLDLTESSCWGLLKVELQPDGRGFRSGFKTLQQLRSSGCQEIPSHTVFLQKSLHWNLFRSKLCRVIGPVSNNDVEGKLFYSHLYFLRRRWTQVPRFPENLGSGSRTMQQMMDLDAPPWFYLMLECSRPVRVSWCACACVRAWFQLFITKMDLCQCHCGVWLLDVMELKNFESLSVISCMSIIF